MFKLSNTVFAAMVASVLLASSANAATLLAPNPVDACNGKNDYGVGHSCAYRTSQGTAQGTCQNDASGVLTCVLSAAERRDTLLASNPVDACNGKNDYGVGHDCAWSTSQGKAEGTCQNDASGVLTCVANTPGRRDTLLAGNPVDACNGKNDYGVGHDCAWSSGQGTSEGTCQADAAGALTCIANAPTRRATLLAGNPVDACNGKNDYGVGHSCAYSSPDGTVNGVCANNASGDLVCVPN